MITAGATEDREHIIDVLESEVGVVWTWIGTRPRLRLRTTIGDGTTTNDGTTCEKKKGKPKSQTNGLCQSKYESYREYSR